MNEGRPHISDYVKSGKVDLLINTPLGKESFFDERSIRRAAMHYRIPCITTIPGAIAAVAGIRALQRESSRMCGPCRNITSSRRSEFYEERKIVNNTCSDVARPPESGGQRGRALRPREGWFPSPASQYGSNHLHHTFTVFKDLLVLESKHLDSKLLKELRPVVVSLDIKHSRMSRTIKFDNDATFRTIKVDNIRTYAVLPTKLLSVELRFPERGPEESLCWREVSAKFSAAFFERSEIVDKASLFHARQEQFWNHPSHGLDCATVLPS